MPTLQPQETNTPGPNANLSLNYPVDNGTGSLTVRKFDCQLIDLLLKIYRLLLT